MRTDDALAEASIVVGDDWQGRGAGTALLERLSRRAREAGITHFVALVLGDNRGAIELFQHFAPGEPENVAPGTSSSCSSCRSPTSWAARRSPGRCGRPRGAS